jgi:hypothetical protein
MRVLSNVMPAAIAILLFMVAINSADVIHKWWEGRGPAITWYGASASPATVRPGDSFEITYTANVHRQCPADIRGFIFAPDGTVPIRFPVISGGYTRPTEGPTEIRVRLVVPLQSDPGLAPLRTGRHIYRNLITRYCPSGVEIDAAVPDVPFHLEVP